MKTAVIPVNLAVILSVINKKGFLCQFFIQEMEMKAKQEY